MTFKSLLKTIGEDALKVVEAVESGPKVIIQEMSAGRSDITAFFDLIKQNERIWAAAKVPGLTGSQKLAGILPDLTAMIGDVEILVGTKISSKVKDQAEFNAGIHDLGNSLVRILNACGD